MLPEENHHCIHQWASWQNISFIIISIIAMLLLSLIFSMPLFHHFIIIFYLPFNYIKNLPRFIEGEETQEATRLTTMYLKKNNCCELADWPIQWLFTLKILYFRLKAEKIWRTRDRNRKGVPNFWTFVENCKLLKICTIHKRSIITSCSCTIAVILAIVTKRLKSNGGDRFLL